MDTVLHFAIRSSDQVSKVTVDTAWGQGEQMSYDLEGRDPDAAGERLWYFMTNSSEDSHLKNVKVTEQGQLEAAGDDAGAVLKIWLSYSGAQRFEVKFDEVDRFVPHFVIDKRAEFAIFSDDLCSQVVKVIRMVPVVLNFQLQTANAQGDDSYDLKGNFSDQISSGLAFKKSHLTCSKCGDCKNNSKDTQVWSLVVERVWLACYEERLCLVDREPLKVQLITTHGNVENATDLIEIELPIDSSIPTQSFLVRLDQTPDQQILSSAYPISHLELHFFCDISDATKKGMQLRGNCSELEHWKKTKETASNRLKITLSAAVQRVEGLKLLKTFDLDDFQFEILLIGLKTWPISGTLHRFPASLEPFSVWEIKVANASIGTPRLSIEPVVHEVTETLTAYINSGNFQMSSCIIKIQVPQLKRMGEIADKDDPQQTHDIWGEDLLNEDPNLMQEVVAKSGLEYLKLRQGRQQNLAERRIVMKRLNKKYHQRQDVALDIIQRLLPDMDLNKIRRNEATTKQYKHTIETVAQQIRNGAEADEADLLQLLRQAAAIVRGRTEALTLNPRGQAWERDSWSRHMMAVEPWLNLCLAIWRTRFNGLGDSMFKSKIEEGEKFIPAFYRWPLVQTVGYPG